MSITTIFKPLTAAEGFSKLPPRLLNFFIKFPPSNKYAEKPTVKDSPTANPFLPTIHPVTKKYHDPVFSMRRQSELFKLAAKFGVEDLLPPMKKKFGLEKYNNKIFMDSVVNPKLKKYEANYESRVKARESAIRNADEIILKERGRAYAKKLEKRKQRERTWY